MSLPDTAEYWNDVKSHFISKPSFIHIKGYDCGHFHVTETNKLRNVTCHSCIKHINKDKSLTAMLDNELKVIKQNKINKWKRKYPHNPDCKICGYVMIKRKNKATGSEFWGCSQYPHCKETKTI